MVPTGRIDVVIRLSDARVETALESPQGHWYVELEPAAALLMCMMVGTCPTGHWRGVGGLARRCRTSVFGTFVPTCELTLMGTHDSCNHHCMDLLPSVDGHHPMESGAGNTPEKRQGFGQDPANGMRQVGSVPRAAENVRRLQGTQSREKLAPREIVGEHKAHGFLGDTDNVWV